MVSRLDGLGAALRSPFPWVALSAALAMTVAGWFAIERVQLEDGRMRFERRGDLATAELRARVTAYEQALRASAAFLANAESSSPEPWSRFLAHLRMGQRLPGLVSTGRTAGAGGGDGEFSLRVAYGAAIKVQDEPAFRAALQAASQSGEAATSALVTLPRAGTTPARNVVFMFVPVHPELDGLPRQERARAIVGHAFAAFAPDELVREGTGDALQAIDVRIDDEANGGARDPLVDTRDAEARSRTPTFQRLVHFPMPGRNWSLRFVSTPAQDRALRAQAPWPELAAGLLGSVLVFLLVTALMEAWNRTHNLSVRDPLTGLYNRRYLEETMSREVPRAARHGLSVAVIVLDLDHFKRLNDSYGHQAGDFVLIRFAELLRNATRGEDIACRFGGEEFGVILPGTSLAVARRRAEAIRLAFQDITFEYEGLRLGHLTVSAGVAALEPEERDWAAVMRQADRALYVAKQAGRNRVLATDEL